MLKYIVVGLLFSYVGLVYAAVSDGRIVREAYDGVTVACTACHPEGNMQELNIYGKHYLEAGRSVEAVLAIDEQDSDGDGVSNGDEIRAGTNPGDPESF